VDLVNGLSERNIMHDKTYLSFIWIIFDMAKNKYKICHVTRYHTIKECKGSADEAPCHNDKMNVSGWPHDAAALCNRKRPNYLLNR